MSPGKGDGFTAGLAKPTKFRARVGRTRVRLPQRRCLEISGGCASLGGDAGDVRRGQDGRTLASGTLGHGVALNVTNLAIPVTSGLKAACGYSGSPSLVSQPTPPPAIGPGANRQKKFQAGKSPWGAPDSVPKASRINAGATVLIDNKYPSRSPKSDA